MTFIIKPQQITTTLFKRSHLLFAVAALHFICALSPVTAVSGELFTHGSAGFSTELPSQWSLQTTQDGIELTKETALLSIENLDIAHGQTSEVMTLFIPGEQGKPINKPYSGLRADIRENGYAAEVVILKTPVSFYLLSLEQDQPDPANLNTFETVLNSFAILDTPPVSKLIDLLPPVNLGPIDLALPEGEFSVEQGYLFWKSNAAGMLTGEVVQLDKAQTLVSLLDQWEKEMLNPETGLTRRMSMLELTIEDRPAVQADYSGDKMQARVQVSAIDKQNALVLTMIARKETFASHQPVLDAVSFSVIPADGGSIVKPDVAPPPKKPPAYNEIVMAVSEQTTLSPDVINKLYQQQPALFSNIKVILADIKALDQLVASDPETLAKNLSWTKMASRDGAMQAFDIAARRYKVSMSLLPKGVQVPAWSEKLARAYRLARNSQHSEPMAYRYALEESGESKGQQDLYTQLLKAKGQTADTIPADMANYLQGKAELYWQNRLEVDYQLDVLKRTRGRVIDQLWNTRRADLDRIRDALQ